LGTAVCPRLPRERRTVAAQHNYFTAGTKSMQKRLFAWISVGQERRPRIDALSEGSTATARFRVARRRLVTGTSVRKLMRQPKSSHGLFAFVRITLPHAASSSQCDARDSAHGNSRDSQTVAREDRQSGGAARRGHAEDAAVAERIERHAHGARRRRPTAHASRGGPRRHQLDRSAVGPRPPRCGRRDFSGRSVTADGAAGD